jgi:hypothetical protein
LGSPQEEQLCKTDPAPIQNALLDRSSLLKPPKFVKNRVYTGKTHRGGLKTLIFS